MWPDVVYHTENLCFAFHPFKCTYSTHQSVMYTLRAIGSHFYCGTHEGFGGLVWFKCLTSVMVLRLEESVVHSFLLPTIPDWIKT